MQCLCPTPEPRIIRLATVKLQQIDKKTTVVYSSNFLPTCGDWREEPGSCTQPQHCFYITARATATRQHSHVHLVTTDIQLRSRAPLVRGSGSGFNIQKQQAPVIHCLCVLSVVTRVDVIQQVVKLPLVSELCIIVCSNHGRCRDRSQGRPCPRPEGESVYYLGKRNMANDN